MSDPSGKYGSFKTDIPVKIIAHCTVAKKNFNNKKLIEVHPRIFYKIQWNKRLDGYKPLDSYV